MEVANSPLLIHLQSWNHIFTFLFYQGKQGEDIGCNLVIFIFSIFTRYLPSISPAPLLAAQLLLPALAARVTSTHQALGVNDELTEMVSIIGLHGCFQKWRYLKMDGL